MGLLNIAGPVTLTFRNALDRPQMKYYAIIPAAGRSRRMGQPKLLMPWQLPSGEVTTVIDCVLRTWTSSLAQRIVVVVSPDDEKLKTACQCWPVDVVLPSGETADMKASVQLGMQHVLETYQPQRSDWCFLAPADLPTLATEVIDTMIQSEKDPRSVTVPVYADKVSHPVLFPWLTMQEINHLSSEQGIDQIVARSHTTRIVFPLAMRPRDIDTPEEYERLRSIYSCD